MKNLFWGLSLAAMALLVACSSGSGTNGEPLEISSNSSSGADLFAETFDDLPVCTAKREGAIAYVKDEKAAYVCENGDWTLDDENATERKSNGDTGNDDKSSASEGVEGSSASVPGSSDANLSGGSLIVANQCKIETEDNCEYGSLTDSRDGQTYRTVKIGGQVWMAENLNFVMDNSWCYNDESDNCDTYGRLYNWAAAVGRDDAECGYGYECELGTGDIRGVCPKGWHLPSQSEWEALIVAVDGSITEYTSSNTAGSKLKSVTGWFDDGNGEDTFGFSALPAGYRNNYGGNFGYGGLGVYFWSSTEDDSGSACSMFLDHDYDNADLGDYGSKYDGYSVRCLKD